MSVLCAVPSQNQRKLLFLLPRYHVYQVRSNLHTWLSAALEIPVMFHVLFLPKSEIVAHHVFLKNHELFDLEYMSLFGSDALTTRSLSWHV